MATGCCWNTEGNENTLTITSASSDEAKATVPVASGYSTMM